MSKFALLKRIFKKRIPTECTLLMPLPVDKLWYLNTYPDVAAANVEPVEHFNRFGLAEGRLPMAPDKLIAHESYAGSVLILELILWRGYSHEAISVLRQYSGTDVNSRVRAKLILAEWYYCQGKIHEVKQWLQRALPDSDACQPALKGAVVTALARCHTVLGLDVDWKHKFASLATSFRHVDRPFLSNELDQYLARHGLAPIPSVTKFAQLADLKIESVPVNRALPLVSVIVPVFNASANLRVAVNSLRAQIHSNLEIILVDDASSDESVAIADQLAAQDARIRILTLAQNGGAYAARNAGVRIATGDFITVHDSDDWSHPQKIQCQVAALIDNPKASYSISYWVRVLPNMRYLGSWLLSNPYLQLNHSSALFRREVIERCGLWDEVRVAGDTEYLMRVRSVHATQSEPVSVDVLPDIPLALSLVHPQSLTQTPATHVSTIYNGLRSLYLEGAAWYHAQHRIDASALPARLEFPAPLGNLPVVKHHVPTLVIADFSHWADIYDDILDDAGAGALLHWPLSARHCADPICDEVWSAASQRQLNFAHHGIAFSVDRVIVADGELLLSRPDRLPQVTVVTGATGIKFIRPARSGFVSAAMAERILACAGTLPSLIELFDAEFYLENNPDVKAAGIAPLTHYLNSGQTEGRAPCRFAAAELETQLWASETSAQGEIVNQLDTLVQTLTNEQSMVEAAYAAWALMRFYASDGQYQQALGYYRAWQDNYAHILAPGHRGPWLIAVTSNIALKLQTLTGLIEDGEREQGMSTDVVLARASAAAIRSDASTQHSSLSQLWQQTDLVFPQWLDSAQPFLSSLDSLNVAFSSFTVSLRKPPLVSVVIPCFNARQTLPVALDSLLSQSWPALEVLVVDDASTDNSADIAQAFKPRFAEKGIQLTVLKQRVNQGAYAARNKGLAQAKGAFITTHDADDWSHPQKIQRQVEALLNDKSRMASVSHWVRATDNLVFGHWRPESSWVHRNVSSLMFRRKVHDELGFWDRVSVDADTEFYYRLVAAYGLRSIVEVMPGVPLAIGRDDPESLTRQSATHLRTQFYGVRYDYQQAARAWHRKAYKARDLYLEDAGMRPFSAPALIMRPSPEQIADEVFDVDWYLAQYPDVKAAGVDPREHFIKWGMAEGRIPGPLLPAHQVRHYEGLEWHQGQPVYLVFAHQVSDNQFGAELSLLDVIGTWQALKRNVIVILPRDSRGYTRQVLVRAQKVHVQPMTWWHSQRGLSQEIIQSCCALIDKYQPGLVYANTLTLWEPLIAARQCGVVSCMHVRELPAADETLCQQLGAGSDIIRQHILELADCFVANSSHVADYLNAPQCTVVVSNQIDWPRFSQVPAVDFDGKRSLRVGLLSSNVAKKGLDDVLSVARQMQAAGAAIEFLLYGPENDYVQQCRHAGLPDNLRFMGYVDDTLSALASLDVVLNLSHFQESFGRSVLEAMAAGRLVVCYAWGALTELVREDVGITVPFRDTYAVGEALLSVISMPSVLEHYAQRARQRAAGYAETAVQHNWRNWLEDRESGG